MENNNYYADGIVVINSDEQQVKNFLVKYLARKEVIKSLVSCEDASDMEDFKKFSDGQFKIHTLLDYSTSGAELKEDLKDLKENLLKAAKKDGKEKEFEEVLNSRWSLIFDYVETNPSCPKRKVKTFGFCNKMEGFSEGDFELTKIK